MNIPDPISSKEIDTAYSNLEKTIKESHASFYPYFERHGNRHKHNAELVNRYYKSGPVLDMGCYPPNFTILLKILGYPVQGIDFNPDRCKHLAERFDLDIIQWDIERSPLPFNDEAFEFVIFSEVLEHLHWDPLFALSEINRIMPIGGTLLLTTPNIYAIQRVARFLSGRSFNDPIFEFEKLRSTGHMGHIREYAPIEIRRFLVMINFRLIKRYFRHYYFPKSVKGLCARILFSVLPSFFRTYQIIVAEKMGPGPGYNPLRLG